MERILPEEWKKSATNFEKGSDLAQFYIWTEFGFGQGVLYKNIKDCFFTFTSSKGNSEFVCYKRPSLHQTAPFAD